MEEILKILDLKLKIAYGAGFSDGEEIGLEQEDIFFSRLKVDDLQNAIKEYAENCIKASFDKLSENVVGEHCFIHVSEFKDDDNIVLL
ncbi:hypothetical protein [Chryseobacterium indologenes]|uniref:hypothetical protein n=1 Tax=Chryseobacterium indologenes TaxID=253 RepID=UPI0009A1BAB1|nr:hypothetical protein [Chryseobacterium indologenes]